MNKQSKPLAFVLVGVPGSGKSYYIDHALKIQYPDAVVLSSDNYIERFAKKLNKTYSEVFESCIKRANRLMIRAQRRAYANKQTIIWDQTSVSVGSRRKKLNMLRGYDVVAVVMNTSDSVVDIRVVNRPGKTISPAIVNRMRSDYVVPSTNEGFVKVVFVTSTSEI